MAKRPKGAPTRFGKRNKEKVRGWIWNAKKKYWKKGKQIYRPKKKKAPTPIDLAKQAKLLRTRKTGQAISIANLVSNDTIYQENEILRSYLALAGVELFQYTNSRTIDGIFNDVSIISVLSSRRKQYTANDIIDIYPAFLRDVWRGTGTNKDKLYIEVDGSYENLTARLEFWVIDPPEDNVVVIGTVDYV